MSDKWIALRRLAASVLAIAVFSAPAHAAKVEAAPGKPSLLIGAFDPAKLGYATQEFFLSGTAISYRFDKPASADGAWSAVPATGMPFTTRVVVIRPTDPNRFNGTVLVEWLNVTSGQDTPADWMVAHREILRRGYAYVAVSAQKVGVEGGASVMGMGQSLKKADPARYGTLSHPGDAYSFDIFSQAGAALKDAQSHGMLGDLRPKHVIAMGESQSAFFLTTYVNAVDPLAQVYDGFFVHSRFGGAAALDGLRRERGKGDIPDAIRFRKNLRVPVLTLITETDLVGNQLPGYYLARRPDSRHLRVWELAGAAHADGYLFGGAFMDDGSRTPEELAKVFWPAKSAPGGELALPYNPGMPHHYVVEAAITALNNWLVSGKAPVSTPLIHTHSPAGGDDKPKLVTDSNDMATGGVRTPWTDVPTMRLSGIGNSGPFVGQLVGVGEPFSKAKLAELYPGGKEEYLRRFTAALDGAIRAGHILPEDRAEILSVAAINFDRAP
jgi:hypothetical protein